MYSICIVICVVYINKYNINVVHLLSHLMRYIVSHFNLCFVYRYNLIFIKISIHICRI